FKPKNAFIIIVLGVLCVVLADAVSSHLLKPYFNRIRPCDLEPFAWHINLVLTKCSGAFSFPSSHAANHFALGSFLALVFYKKLKWLSYLLLFWASLICFAQIYVGVHFPSDVLGGAVLGGLIALVAFVFYRKVII
ncbi:MAG: phosphatase PAP2 family protein, partial [Bacteroidetes bacterium]|nr:phosphatase PAP2 family protein [Bacteroidota bacterium]